MKLQGIFSPITTPFNHEGELWKVKVQHNIEKWNATGLSGYVVVASTGESVMLSTDEKIQLWEWVAQWAAPEKLLIAGTGMDSVHQTVALTNRAADIGYKAALVKTPSFFKGQFSKPETQMLFFRAVADQAKIPVLLYNFPQNTGVDLAAEAVAELSHHPNIIGIKESSGNVEKLMQMVRETKKGFQVLTGFGHHAGAVARHRLHRRHSGVRQSRALRDHFHLGSASHARARGRAGLAESHRPRRQAGDHEVRHRRAEVRDGSDRLLRRSAASAAHGSDSRGQAGDRRSVRGSARLT